MGFERGLSELMRNNQTRIEDEDLKSGFLMNMKEWIKWSTSLDLAADKSIEYTRRLIDCIGLLCCARRQRDRVIGIFETMVGSRWSMEH